MRSQSVSKLMLSVVLLLLAGGSNPVHGVPPAELGEAVGAVASSTADAPWVKMEVDTDGDTGHHVSLAIDPVLGGVYISYYDVTNQDLRVAHYRYDLASAGNCGPGDSWYCQTVDSEGDVGQYNSIAAIAGGVNIAYHDATNGDLKWAESTDAPYHHTWRVRTVDRGAVPVKTGLYTSLSLPSYGSPRISYHLQDPAGDDALKLAVYVGGGGDCGYGEHAGKWRCYTIQTGEGVGQHTSLAIDDDWYRHIAYYDAVTGALWYATNSSETNCGPGDNTWHCIPISGGGDTDVGRYASMYVDSDSRFHIAYYDAIHEALYYAVKVGGDGNCGAFGSAQCDEIDNMPADYHPVGISIAEDAAGYPIIAYQGEYDSLKLARPIDALGLPASEGNCGPVPEGGIFPTWFCEEIDPHGAWVHYHNGDYAAIEVNSGGLTTIAYERLWLPHTAADANLMVAQQRAQVFLPLIMRVY
jgi:hypothetical protein